MPWPPKTVTVTHNDDPNTVRVINESDFDTATMTKTDAEPEKKKRGRPKKTAEE